MSGAIPSGKEPKVARYESYDPYVEYIDKNRLMTEKEHALVTLLGEAASIYCKDVAGEEYEWDQMEFVDKIHQLQHSVMSQAAARAFPEKYRLQGMHGDWKKEADETT